MTSRMESEIAKDPVHAQIAPAPPATLNAKHIFVTQLGQQGYNVLKSNIQDFLCATSHLTSSNVWCMIQKYDYIITHHNTYTLEPCWHFFHFRLVLNARFKFVYFCSDVANSQSEESKYSSDICTKIKNRQFLLLWSLSTLFITCVLFNPSITELHWWWSSCAALEHWVN